MDQYDFLKGRIIFVIYFKCDTSKKLDRDKGVG